MATQYTTKLKFALPTQGELDGSWGTTVNNNITSMIEEAIAGYSTINSWSSNSHTLTTADGTTAESRAAMLSLTDSGDQLGSNAATVICPALSKVYIVKNAVGQNATLKTSSGTGIAIPNGKTMLLYCDGTNVVEGVDYIAAALTTGSTITSTGDITASGGTLGATGDTAAGDDAAVGYTSAEGLILTGQGSTNDVTIKNDADADVLVIPTGATNVDIVGVATATTFEPDGDTAAGDNAAIGYTSAEGLILTGQGSTNDVTIKNDADADVLEIPTGGTNVTVVGDVTVGGTLGATGDTAAGDDAAIGYTSAEGIIITGQGSTNDVTIKNDADADVITIATGTTNVDIVGVATAATFEPDGDTSASDNAAIGYTSAEGLILTGQGSTNDVTIKNDADAEVMGVLTGTTTAAFTGQVTGTGFTGTLDGILGSGTPAAATVTTIDASGVATATTFEPDGDTSASDNAAIGYTSAEGIIITGQGSTNDITLKNDADAEVCGVPTGTDDLRFPDDAKTEWGAGGDLQIYHDASNSYITDNGTGNLKIGSGNQVDILGTAETLATFVDDGAVSLYHNDGVKIATTATGIQVTGTALATTDTDTSNTGSVTLDFETNQNFILTFTGNVTLANPTTEQLGQSGIIICIQDGTGSRTLSLGTDYETAGAAGITLSTAANAVDIIPYFVQSASNILLGAVQKAFA